MRVHPRRGSSLGLADPPHSSLRGFDGSALLIALVSDIHSNIVALEAVIADARRQFGGPDQVWSLGDQVGYGPWPNECLDLIKSWDHLIVAGNHDLAAVGRERIDFFNADAAICCQWNAAQLTRENQRYLMALKTVEERGDFTLVHGSLRDPVWEYLIHEEAAAASLSRLTTRFLLVGHSHLPLAFLEGDGGVRRVDLLSNGGSIGLGEYRLVFCPGSVGQPRDGDPRAAYALLDTDLGTLEVRRVDYDVTVVQAEMRRVGLPPRMSERLSHGW